MSLRLELVTLASQEGANLSELAKRFGVSRKTLYKWKARFAEGGGTGSLADRSRRPRRSPSRSPAPVEQRVVQVRREHPAWGGRKIRAVLLRDGGGGAAAAEPPTPPAASTITRILHRHELIDPRASGAAERYLRFEHPASNDLWQMDFKGDFALCGGGRCHPLTVLDDHSRYALCLRACGDQRQQTVLASLERVFRRYGLPRRMLMDNGSPWGVAHDPGAYTRLEVWLMRLDVSVTHGRVYHPQTQGKEERFHRTLKLEVLQGRQLEHLPQAQRAFDDWLPVYNHHRPHEALGMAVPASRYQPSGRGYPATLPEVQYPWSDQVRSINPVGQLQFHGRRYKLSEAFGGQRVGLRPRAERDGVWQVCFGRFIVGVLDERAGNVTMSRQRQPAAGRGGEGAVPAAAASLRSPAAAGRGVTHVPEHL